MSRRKADTLTVQQGKYVEGRARGLSPTESALAAGYTRSYSLKAVNRIDRLPAVAQAIAVIQAKARELSVYDLTVAMRESEEVIAFAKEHRNAMAYFKAVEHRAKLSGLLIDRIQVATVDIKSALDDAHRRIRDISPVNPRISSDDSPPNKKQGGGGAGGGGSGNA